MGGINVNPETAESTLPGLFAAGEAAAGLHGANRLGGNSLSDLLVFGRRAGAAAADYAKKVAAPNIDSRQIEENERAILAPFERKSDENPYTVHQDLQRMMQSLVGIFRVKADLEQALAELEKLKARAKNVQVEGSRMFNPGWHLAIDLGSMLICSEAVARGALAREESRGGHSRLDFPKTSTAEWSKQNNVVVRDGETMVLKQVPLPEMPADLQKIMNEEDTAAAATKK
jgi:succinate dehydrogenase / fumarate reductase flavoprotein subunit